MLGVLCARSRPWLLTSLSLSYAHALPAAHFDRWINKPLGHILAAGGADRKEKVCGGTGSIWHAILPTAGRQRRWKAVFSRHEHETLKKGEGSWNVSWDARPARWLHHPHSAWLLFGIGACLAAPVQDLSASSPEPVVSVEEKVQGIGASLINADTIGRASPNYRVTGVPADGRCLFRAIAHMACLRNGEEAPDEDLQRELADELRAQVVEELLRRRKEVEWFIEEDFDVYAERIRQPYTWGGEPELLMASHVLKLPISVYMINRASGTPINIANYGEDYKKDGESSINVLFHGYGHYDILETIPDPGSDEAEA